MSEETSVIMPGPFRLWKWWVTQAIVEFMNGMADGSFSGIGGGGAYASTSDTLDAQTLSIKAAEGFLVILGGHGLQAFVIWRKTNPMPNPWYLEKPK